MKDRNRYPKGWNLARVQSLINYYDNQTEAEQVAEIEAMYAARKEALMTVPLQLVPKFKKLISAHRAKARSIRKGKTSAWRDVANGAIQKTATSANSSKNKKKAKNA